MGAKVSLVISVYNEEQVLPIFWKELKQYLAELQPKEAEVEVLFVNDGSTDKSAELIDSLAKENNNVTGIHFSTNFGHEAAMLAGIENATGDAIICMDSDLQHPPAEIEGMLNKFKEGYEVVTMVRVLRTDGGTTKKISSSLFYRIFNRISKEKIEPNVSDFFLISKRVAQVISTEYRERTRFLRGLVQTVGFKKISIDYIATDRAAGTSKYSLSGLFSFSLTALSTFSHAPLRLGIGVGLMFGAFSLILGIYSIVMKFLGQPFSGYTTLIVFMSFGFSLLFFVIGIIGEYIGHIFREVKNRPIYIIERKTLSNYSER